MVLGQPTLSGPPPAIESLTIPNALNARIYAQ